MSTPESTEINESAENESADAAQTPSEEASSEQPEASGEAGDLSVEATERIEELQQELSSVQNELDEVNEKYLRKAAEFENFRRRMDRETTRRYSAGQVDVVKAMLGVLDDMGRSMDASEELAEKQDAEAAYDSLRNGVEMVHRKFVDELQSLGVERIDAEGEPFDESLHEAMMQQPAPEGVEPGTVLTEVQPGYRMGDRVIRHSRVIVAS
ncbi:nucleotide exchange factor GrpE [Longibacter salinarum]|uniref:Protein GrpE n=1 Tax=Longibacter salinarum TaxID=1850348 RepID=A0A2A8D3X2_9BACT|nr:nucleotide exchange factor GrpE [Longibacter salinarum]PEN15328.1 nucleotide exchange factor GrpE [Longibacter salinarum]